MMGSQFIIHSYTQMADLNSIMHAVIAIFAIIVSMVSFSEMTQCPLLTFNRAQALSQESTNIGIGRLTRNWFFFTLGTSNLILWICETIFFLLYSMQPMSQTVLAVTDSVLFLILRYLPTTCFFVLFSIIAIYVLELSISQTGEMNVYAMIMYWHSVSAVLLGVLLVVALVTKLHFALFPILATESFALLNVIAYCGRSLLARLPVQPSASRATTSASAAVSSKIRRRLLLLYISSLVCLIASFVYYLLLALHIFPAPGFQESRPLVVTDAAIVLLTEAGFAVCALVVVGRAPEDRWPALSVSSLLASLRGYRPIPSDSGFAGASYSSFPSGPSLGP